jgi:ketosteroid isomerase-like protein
VRRALRALAALAWMLAPAPAFADSPSEAVDAFHFALKAGNTQKALELLTADVLVFEQGRLERSRTEYARRHLAEDMKFASATTRSISRRSTKMQGNTAWVMSVNRSRGKFNNRPVDFTTTETMVLARISGKWRIVHIHWSFDDRSGH